MSEGKLSLYKTLCKDLEKSGYLKVTTTVLRRPEALAIYFYRVSSRLHKRGKISWFFGMIAWRLNVLINGCDFDPRADIAPGLKLRHTVGIVVGPIKAGENLTLYHGTTFARKYDNQPNSPVPEIGDNVTVFSGACVVGDIKIGNNVTIGANSVVLKDVPDNSTAVGVPAKIIQKT